MRFMYLRKNGHPVAVLATSLIRAGGGNIQADMVAWALSTCNPLDRFNKELGKSLAAGRLWTKMPQRLMLVGEGNTKGRILTVISKDRTMPQRAREAARSALAAMKAMADVKRGPNMTDTTGLDFERATKEPTPVHARPATDMEMAEIERNAKSVAEHNPLATGCPTCDNVTWPKFCEVHKHCRDVAEVRAELTAARFKEKLATNLVQITPSNGADGHVVDLEDDVHAAPVVPIAGEGLNPRRTHAD